MKKLTVKEGVCPLCGKDSVGYYDYEVCDKSFAYECECESCGATWNEDYSLTFEGVSCVCTKDGEEVADVLDAGE